MHLRESDREKICQSSGMCMQIYLWCWGFANVSQKTETLLVLLHSTPLQMQLMLVFASQKENVLNTVHLVYLEIMLSASLPS